MGLIVLVAIGGILGWLASIICETEDGQDILLNIAVALVGALGCGGLTNPGPLQVGVSPWALLAALIGGMALLTGLAILRRTVLR
ncbi:GlsB/YeaQ/YmgE family stress response membrane protein [Erythrobacter sp. LQ02-29]|uniref:GlsB/YeaQ/YmgE family stress response membrane protein n=1 Tax=Erythrobacter sp. LQ02-29 TaxID=2920384 RepID=UPI001F4E3D0C|nr:GlsB/YeaQ/YmgE family stress response membrane protein [Erythrobacter sp. LQ02-29]MCP9221991.1 GlsB/YeaQ/YmgE family stress response membrane protein [Erythrobacter sp. LQ02-29]